MVHFAGLLVLSVWVLAASSVLAAEPWKPGPGWKLVWADEFTGKSLDKKNWTHELGAGGWGNNELQTYTDKPENSYIQDGKLVIQAIKTETGYTSARLTTLGKKSWKYGKFAARMKLPYGQGIWPAFWMLGANIKTVGWPKCGEIDIMEMVGGGEGRDDTILGTLHWSANNRHASHGSKPQRLSEPQFFYQDYHVFEIEWDAKEIAWKLDGKEYFRTGIDIKQWPTMDEFHHPFSFLLNVAVGGNWPGSPNETTVFPQKMYVDWIRVYQR
jgi:beta-glucanase (GH16 family)